MTALKVDSSGSVAITGRTESADLPAIAAFRPKVIYTAAFVTTLNAAGNASFSAVVLEEIPLTMGQRSR